MAQHSGLPLFEFTNAAAAFDWQAVNDSVMGGVSQGSYRITEQQTLEFFGTLSLENNGGFASLRSKAKTLDLKQGDTVQARVKGDGREYSLNLYLNQARVAFSYRVAMPTQNAEWTEITVPLAAFVATSFGRVVPDAGPVNPDQINALGFMLSDKTAGPFLLEVAWLKRERTEG